MCRHLEEFRVWSERCRSPPSSRNGLLEPVNNNAFYTSHSRNFCSEHLSSSNYRISNRNSSSNNNIYNPNNVSHNISRNTSTLSSVKCWNCGALKE